MLSKITILLMLFFMACSTQKNTIADPATLAKINFDISKIDEQGRYGPADGKRTLDYEFCIPKTEEKMAIIRKIDPDIQMPGQSRGRIGCGKMEQLCLGNTGGKADWKKVLLDIAGQDFVKRIEQNYYE